MSDDVRYTIEGDESEHDQRSPAPHSLTEDQRGINRAIGQTNYWRNEKLALNRQAAETKLHTIEAQTDVAANEAKRALEEGRFDDHSAATARIADLRVQRGQAENEYNHYARQPALPTDPVEDCIARRSAPTAAWLRAHPSVALAISTNYDPARSAEIDAAHQDALARGHAVDTDQYFRHVEKRLGMAEGRRSRPVSEGGKRQVRVLAPGKASDPNDPNQMTRGEYQAATETVLWGREGGDKCGTPYRRGRISQATRCHAQAACRHAAVAGGALFEAVARVMAEKGQNLPAGFLLPLRLPGGHC
jgi:multidrug efflux pump subunit AcrA (membrane-fusion protein)